MYTRQVRTWGHEGENPVLGAEGTGECRLGVGAQISAKVGYSGGKLSFTWGANANWGVGLGANDSANIDTLQLSLIHIFEPTQKADSTKSVFRIKNKINTKCRSMLVRVMILLIQGSANAKCRGRGMTNRFRIECWNIPARPVSYTHLTQPTIYSVYISVGAVVSIKNNKHTLN